MHALYAEDDPNVSTIVRTYFEHFAPGSTLEIVPTGRACLDRMAQGGVDVLILDLVLPDIDGLHVLGELAMRGDPTPVVMASGHGQNELAVKALRAGAVDCVDKTSPQFLRLVEIVKRVHERHQESLRAPLPPPVRTRHRVLLVEGSVAVRRAVADFFARHAPQLDLLTAANPAELEVFFKQGAEADAVLIGPTPGTASQLEVLRNVHSQAAHLPVVILSSRSDGETAIAAFKLGAQDYILQKPDYLAEVVFSLGHIMRRADMKMHNAHLTRELEKLNRSLEAQVATRTAELQALSMRLLRVQEDERRAIARELHDQIGQMLTGLKFQLEAAAQLAPAPVKEKLAESLALATDLLANVRALTQQFRPRILDDLGLAPALEWHVNRFQHQSSLQVSLEVTLPAQRLPAELETVVFRTVQEALTNAARHSGAAAAAVAVTHAAGKLIVEITDRGRGFEVEARLASRESIGLIGLRERAALVGGTVEIFSKSGHGSRILAEFPLPV
ncbi:MAG: response regulator [Opitutae bacterium]|nr:response regulator [Opitutae bacterium]